MTIQRSVNQLVSLASLLAMKSPKAAKMSEERAKEAVHQETEAKAEAISGAIPDDEARRSEELSALYRKEFDRTASSEALRESLKYEESAKKARESLQRAQEKKRKTRRNFMQYLANMPTSWGGKFGDLPKEQQKLAAAEYSKSERKRIMDRMDMTHGKK